MPSRRFYVAKKKEYEDVMKVKSRKRLSLRKKKSPTYIYSEEASDEEDFGFSQIQNKLAKVR